MEGRRRGEGRRKVGKREEGREGEQVQEAWMKGGLADHKQVELRKMNIHAITTKRTVVPHQSLSDGMSPTGPLKAINLPGTTACRSPLIGSSYCQCRERGRVNEGNRGNVGGRTGSGGGRQTRSVREEREAERWAATARESLCRESFFRKWLLAVSRNFPGGARRSDGGRADLPARNLLFARFRAKSPRNLRADLLARKIRRARGPWGWGLLRTCSYSS